MRLAPLHENSTSGRIALALARTRGSNQSALVPFIVAGDPDLECTQRLVLELEMRGADLIELGVPFSDPMADGPANQRAAARGLASGATLPAILALVAELRKHSQIPIILFGYFNPIFRYGCERLCADARRAGVDGLLVVDLPPEEASELAAPARADGLDLIYLLAPTTSPERSRMIASSATGFLYYVSVTGVTGARAVLAADLEQRVTALKSITDLPIGVGFGISTAEQAREVARFADAVVVGSAFSQLIELHVASEGLVSAVGEFAGTLKGAIGAARQGPTSSSR
jgi:tryptophan synthase alpha chain